MGYASCFSDFRFLFENFSLIRMVLRQNLDRQNLDRQNLDRYTLDRHNLDLFSSPHPLLLYIFHLIWSLPGQLISFSIACPSSHYHYSSLFNLFSHFLNLNCSSIMCKNFINIGLELRSIHPNILNFIPRRLDLYCTLGIK